MPMGIVSDSDFESELGNCSKPAVLPEIIDINHGRGNGNVEVPESLKKIIGETSAIDGRQEALALASRFGISPSSVSAYAQGATSTASYNTPSTDIKNHINQAKERVSRRARMKLMQALNHITKDKLSEAKVSELAIVAKSMSGIVKDMEPDTPEKDTNKEKPQFVIYAPQFRDERTFETIHVKE